MQRRGPCLDGCFSGGMGVKVFDDHDPRAKELASREVSLAPMAGMGRVLFMASGAHQPAFEFLATMQ
jgi:hypothetical protein